MKNFNRIQSLKDISKNLSVLYVDDDEDLVNRTKKFLIKIFKHVDLATNGVEGLDFYKEYYNKTAKNYDIIISDIYMPNMNGIAMSKAILDINKDQKIIILSAYKERNYLLDIISLGIDSFIQKPFDIKQMLEVLYKVCITFQFEDLQYFKALTEASIVSKTDIDGIIIYANDNFCNITGYSRKEIIGKTHSLFKHPDNPDSLYDDLWKVITSGNIWRERMTNLNKNGSHFIADSTIIPLLDHNGNIKEYMAIHNDITDRVELKRELFEKEQMHEKEERIKEAQKSFLVVFTHELKTPLNAIINFSKYVKKQMHSPEKINYNKCSTLLDSVLSNASDMLDNITQILEISKLNSGKLTYTHTLFNANEIIEHTIRKFDSLLESNNIKLTFETKNEAFIYSDELRVKQIISNILSNAIKYGKGKISVIVFRNSLITEISITDNGPGIRDKESIFNLYTQEDEGLLDRKGKGTGIGLYFLKLLCQDLHINYKVEDAEVDSGTRFTLTFKNKPIKG